jgi:orotate phosphoribosyltransferase
VHSDEVLRILRETGVTREGHYRLTSGLHTNLFLLSSMVQQYPVQLARLAAAMAYPFRDQGVQVVAGPAVGGVILAYEVARALGARAIFAEKIGDGRMALRRGFRVGRGERVLVVEDAVSTGGSMRKVMDAVRPYGPHIVGASVIIDRSGGAVDLGVPLHALVTMTVPMWEPAACPLCRAGSPVLDPKAMTEGAVPAP